MLRHILRQQLQHCEGGILHFNGEDAELWDVNWEQDWWRVTGSGCVTGLETGDYAVEATDPFLNVRCTQMLQFKKFAWVTLI